MKKKGPSGIITPLVTTFDKNENLDEKAYRREIRYLISCGVHGISPGGSTGEGSMISDEELSRMVEICSEEKKGTMPVVAGVIRSSTKLAVKTGIVAGKAGATALMVTPTFYNVLVPDSDGNFDFYKRIAGETGLPIIIYNVVPQNEIKPDLFVRLCEIDGVIGVKQSVGGIQSFYDMLMMCRGKGLVYSATDDMLYTTFDLGAQGAIAAILSVFPKECVAIWDAVKAGNHIKARKLQEKIYPLWQVLKGPQFPRRIKEALRQMGRDVGISLSPNLEATPQEKSKIRELING